MKIRNFYIFNIIYTSFYIYCLLNLSKGVFAEEEDERTEIKIFIRQPDMPYIYDTYEWSIYYNELMNKKFDEMVERDGISILKNVDLNFTFYEYEPMTSSYPAYYLFIDDLVYYWIDDPSYDLFVFDDRLLFSEFSFMESDYVESYFRDRKFSVNYLVNLSEYINKDDLKFNHPRILDDGISDDFGKRELYGLPYEMDFEVLYYFNDDDKANAIVKDMKNLTWDDVWKKIESSNDRLKVALGDDNDMFSFFIEYTNGKYNMTKEYDKYFYNMLYNDTAESIFTSFRQLIENFSDEGVRNTIFTIQDDAYDQFMIRNTTFFKGKASHHYIFDNDEENRSKISMTLPPKYLSTVIEKYLTISKLSNIDTKVLVEAAKILTSKEMQLFKAEHFGSIPTFDISKKNEDNDIKSFCQSQSTICDWIEKMKRIVLKDFFKSRYSSPLFEIELTLSPRFKKHYLMNNDISTMIFVFKNMHELITFDLGICEVLSYLYTGTIAISFLVTIYYVYINREHPYLKVISPIFCNMIIFGCILGMIMPLRLLPPYSHFKIKLFSVIQALGQNLIYIPMFAITYRIYAIFQSKSFISNKLNNKHLFIGISIIMSISVLYRTILVFIYEYYYYPFGSIISPRYPADEYTGYVPHDQIHQIYFYIIFIALLFMMLTTGSVSKKFGDVCYVYVIFGLNISDFIVKRLLEKFSHEHYNLLYLLVIVFNGLSYFVCVYVLVGSRLLFILMYSSEFEEKAKNITSNDLREFVPLQNRSKYIKLFDKIKSVVSLSLSNLNNKSSKSNLNSKTFDSSDGKQFTISEPKGVDSTLKASYIN